MVELVGRELGQAFGDAGLRLEKAHWNLSVAQLVEHIIRKQEAPIGRSGTILAETGRFTGRSPRDKFIVREPSSDDKIWWGSVNRDISSESFDSLHQAMLDFFEGREAYVRDAAAGARERNQVPIRVVTETAWHNLFSRHLFRASDTQGPLEHEPQLTILHAPSVTADPELHGTNSEAFILAHFGRGLALIGGTPYAGEIKKTIFSMLNYSYPQEGILTMHCSANVGGAGDVALFFGLSGTGKTTLSSDIDRFLIGDDEHAWDEQGVFNIEGGCYAKMIRLDSEKEPLIWQATQQFGTVLENVVFDPEIREADFDDDSLTENTRGAYPLDHVSNHVASGEGGHPRNIFFLSADAFGVLPPLAKLTPDQAKYYFLSGYTAQLAGTEKGLGNEPRAVFSTCFAAPFLPLAPDTYARMLGEKIDRHRTTVWLVNTGWTAGPFGIGHRMELAHTRALIKAAMNADFDQVEFEQEPAFGLHVPARCAGVPEEVLKPRQTWDDPQKYDQQATDLARRFAENFEKYREQVVPEVLAAGPTL